MHLIILIGLFAFIDSTSAALDPKYCNCKQLDVKERVYNNTVINEDVGDVGYIAFIYIKIKGRWLKFKIEIKTL